VDEFAHPYSRIEEQFEQDLLLRLAAVLDVSEEPFQIGVGKQLTQPALFVSPAQAQRLAGLLRGIRDRSYENQRHRASGLNLLVAAIILWNTTYLQRAVDHLRNQGHYPASGDLAHLSPLGWEHINLTGDYHWDTSPTLGPGEFRPLRTHAHAFAAAA
jgi:hypothetical protein